MPVYLNGLMLGLSLIASLGPQNVFLIRQGVMRKHATLSAIVCFVCDVLLVTASVVGLHRILDAHQSLRFWLALSGAAFMLYYGLHALRRSMKVNNKGVQTHQGLISRWQIIFLALGFSLLNPYAIVDTFLLIGGSSSQYPDHQQAFLFGVLTSSLIWFSALTVATYYFAPVLQKAKAWKRIERFSGLLMAALSIKLFLQAFRMG